MMSKAPNVPAAASLHVGPELPLGEQYELIGECYVHGMMKGECFRHREDSGNPVKEFVLV